MTILLINWMKLMKKILNIFSRSKTKISKNCKIWIIYKKNKIKNNLIYCNKWELIIQICTIINKFNLKNLKILLKFNFSNYILLAKRYRIIQYKYKIILSYWNHIIIIGFKLKIKIMNRII